MKNSWEIKQIMGNKTNLIHRKREMFDKIMKESDLDNEQYEKILSKKSFDRKSFKSLGKIFPENEKMDDLINAINLHLEKKNNYRYNSTNII